MKTIPLNFRCLLIIFIFTSAFILFTMLSLDEAVIEDYYMRTCSYTDGIKLDNTSAKIVLRFQKRFNRYTINSINQRNQTSSATNFITIDDCGRRGCRLGNRMFQVASLLGIAMSNNLIPIYRKISVFEHDDKAWWNIYWLRYTKYWVTIKEDASTIFYNDSSALSVLYPRQDILIGKYLQSFRYFKDISDILRQEFTFTNVIRLKAITFYLKLNESLKAQLLTSTLIGIHVRRTDMLDPSLGRNSPNISYYENAINYYKTKIQQPLIFIVCSDDIHWAKTSMRHLSENIVFSDERRPAVDLAILSLCDHVIMSVGTFGWWAGYLAGGQVVYYRNQYVKGSKRYMDYNNADFIPPGWVGLT